MGQLHKNIYLRLTPSQKRIRPINQEWWYNTIFQYRPLCYKDLRTGILKNY